MFGVYTWVVYSCFLAGRPHSLEFYNPVKERESVVWGSSPEVHDKSRSCLAGQDFMTSFLAAYLGKVTGRHEGTPRSSVQACSPPTWARSTGDIKGLPQVSLPRGQQLPRSKRRQAQVRLGSVVRLCGVTSYRQGHSGSALSLSVVSTASYVLLYRSALGDGVTLTRPVCVLLSLNVMYV